MTSRERVLTALRGGIPDKVPFMDLGVDHVVGSAIMGRSDYSAAALAETLGMDAIGYPLYPPIYTVNKVADDGRSYIVGGRLQSRADLGMIALTDPDAPGFLDGAKRFIDGNKGDRAVFAATNIGLDPLLLGMGLEAFSYALADDPELIDEILDIYVDWVIRLVRRLPEVGFDFVWATDDIAYKTGPMFSPKIFKETLLPKVMRAAKEIPLPWVYHSDGNLMPIVDDLLSLGMNGLHPFEPGAMDIRQFKASHGGRVCIVGNVDVGETLTLGSPDGVKEEVRRLIEDVGRGGGYIISSSNSFASYCRPENVIAMAEAVRMYGGYLHTRMEESK